VAGLRASGIVAPLVLDGPMKGEWFKANVEQTLGPALSPGDVVVIDNLAARARRSSCGRGRVLLPPLSLVELR
jgi:transposase